MLWCASNSTLDWSRGTVSNSIGYIGFNAGSTGTVTVGGDTGTSTWTNCGQLIVGSVTSVIDTNVAAGDRGFDLWPKLSFRCK